MSSFTPSRERDAWAVIRGYVYQVDLTIERWLTLTPNQFLELECGEDIDLITQAVNDQTEQQRILEQVKARVSNLTLRSVEAIIAIANALEHRTKNPKSRLIFRYVTNAQIGKEKKSTFPTKILGIEAWNQFYLGRVSKSDIGSFLAGIRNILSSVPQPKKVPEDSWKIYTDFFSTADDTQLVAFIRSFEWSIGSPKPESLESSLKSRLISLGYASDDLHADKQYKRLFFHVFKILSRRGSKRLTIESRSEQLDLPNLSEHDLKLFEKLTTIIHAIGARIEKIEHKLSQHSKQLAKFDTHLASLTKNQSLDANLSYILTKPVLEIPPQVVHLSPRRKTVEILHNILINHSWTAIHGDVGSGKTQLAVLVAMFNARRTIWIRLRDLRTVQAAALRLDEVCESVFPRPPQQNFYSWYYRVCTSLGDKGIIVLDDLPVLRNGDELAERLVQLARACSECNVTLLSTGSKPIPTDIVELLGDKTIKNFQNPVFSNQEAHDVFRSFGAPETILNDKIVNFLNIQANKHPVLLTALAKYLQRNNWDFKRDVIIGLTQNGYASEIKDETIGRLIETIENNQSRELLYRLNLIFTNFTVEEVNTVASVQPIVHQPLEHLHALDGLWVQKDAEERLSVSPLVRALGNRNLVESIMMKCHYKLGIRILRKRSLNQIEIYYAILHFVSAKEFDDAASLLILALQEFWNIEYKVEDYFLLSLWVDQPLPSGMSLVHQLMIRGYQIAIRYKYGDDISFLTKDLETLISKATDRDAWAVVGATIITNAALAQTDSICANEFLLRAINLLPLNEFDKGGLIEFPEDIRLETLFWMNTVGMSNAKQVQHWMETVNKISKVARHYIFASSLSEEGCMQVANALWSGEKLKKEAERDWDAVHSELNALSKWAKQIESELLWTCALRARIIVIAEFQDDLERAVKIAKDVRKEISADPRVQFLLDDIIGRQYLFSRNFKEARKWLEKALAHPTKAYPETRFNTLLYTCESVGNTDIESAVKYASEAVTLAQSFDKIAGIYMIKALGELAITKWLSEGVTAAFESWEKAAKILLTSRDESDEWKSIFVLFGHVSGYFAGLAVGKPPQNVYSGERYEPPRQGIFLLKHSERGSYYKPSTDSILYAQMTMFAEVVGNYELATWWALEGLKDARRNNQVFAIGVLQRSIIPYLILNAKYNEAFDAALEGAKIPVALRATDKSGEDIFLTDIDIDSILDSDPQVYWPDAENMAFLIGVLPAVFYTSILSLEGEDRWITIIEELLRICKRMENQGRDKLLWRGAKELFEYTCSMEKSFNYINNFSSSLDSNLGALQVSGYLCATMQSDATYVNVLSTHLSVLPFIQNSIGSQSTIYGRIILDPLVDYWIAFFNENRFRFTTPAVLAQSLVEVRSSSENDRAQVILRAIVEGLGLKLPPEIKKWLHQSNL